MRVVGKLVMTWIAVVACLPARAEPPAQWPGTAPLRWEGDLASRMVAGADRFLLRKLEQSVHLRARHWNRDTSSVAAYNQSLQPHRARLSHILGMRDPRPLIDGLELVTITRQPSLLATASSYDIHQVRWPAAGGMHGEGLLLVPHAAPKGLVVAIPDADQTPEQAVGLVEGVPEPSQFARRLAENECLVVVPALISRGRDEFPWNGRQHSISHREFLYRSAYELGRHVIGYELHKIAAAIDALQAQYESEEHSLSVGVFGYGEGGMLALYAAALDTRVDVTVVSGYWDDRNTIWQQPIERNVFSLLEQFGDAELATMVAPRVLMIEACDHPAYTLPPGTGGAPAKIITPALETVQHEAERARSLLAGWDAAEGWLTVIGSGAGPAGQNDTLEWFLEKLQQEPVSLAASRELPQPVRPLPAAQERLIRQMQEMDRHTQSVLHDSARVRRAFMQDLDTSSLERYAETVEHYRDIFRHEVIGHYDDRLLDPNPRSRKLMESDHVVYYEIVLDVYPDVFAYGILCVPRDIKPGERRPVVVCQHGLEGRPQSVIGEKDAQHYRAFATRLAERGFITFAPQNPYIFQDRFRTLQRKSYPLKKTLFSLIVPQHQQIVDWLQSLEMVDPERIAFYGLSYGGKTAMRVPPLVTDYCLSICSADFNEWVDKNASTHHDRSYVWTGEYEIFEWDLGSTFNYAEMAALIAPRPFMVERGHFDTVADDWTVAWEYAKVRNLYAARLKLPDRTEIEWFDGPHAINGEGTFRFLEKHLK